MRFKMSWAWQTEISLKRLVTEANSIYFKTSAASVALTFQGLIFGNVYHKVVYILDPVSYCCEWGSFS